MATNATALRKRATATVEAECHSKDSCEQSIPPKGRRSGWHTNTAMKIALVLLLMAAGYVSVNNRSHAVIRNKQKRQRFPKYGTEEFARQCNWTVPGPHDTDPTCSFLVRPPVRSNEGIAAWASQITRAYMQARQVGCKVVFDYGVDVDISQVITPFSNPKDQIHNWTVPSDVVCDTTCQTSVMHRLGNWSKHPEDVPNYRHFFTFSSDFYYRGDYAYMPQVFPGFQIETGMACALGNLFHLAPAAAQFESQLFTKILPALNDDEALVIALYMRTNRADVMAVSEKRNEPVAAEVVGKYKSVADN